MKTVDDPIIPFRVSHANAIASNAMLSRMLLALNVTELTILAAFVVMVVH